ncbi:hypothetical protein L1987_33695 [Smallanthus sonchifolius]|uniref:Uncharacterized protein n=1 Tax=Smallanthus sonchifolius TaxID=185202 RepID=A0ACB9HRR9_9ASTR|nr:hypothetical protein L1987_33695 [Smallanthus sonchifolius]
MQYIKQERRELEEKLRDSVQEQRSRQQLTDDKPIYGLKEIKSATNNFSDKNLITKSALGKVYEGRLSWHGNLMSFTIVKELKEVSELQSKHANLEHATVEDKSSITLKMEFLKIPLSKIIQATNDFDEAFCVGSGGALKWLRREAMEAVLLAHVSKTWDL